MKHCNRCFRPFAITSTSHVRVFTEPFIYQLYGECACGSTWAVTMWEAPDEDDVLLDGDLREVTNSLSDLRGAA